MKHGIPIDPSKQLLNDDVTRSYFEDLYEGHGTIEDAITILLLSTKDELTNATSDDIGPTNGVNDIALLHLR